MDSSTQPAAPKQSWLTMPVAILIAGVLISASILFTSGDSTSLTAAAGDSLPARVVGPTELATEGDPVIGDPDAPITIVEFSDFQCPYCRLFWSESFDLLKTTYIDTGIARLVYRDFPLNFHDAAFPSAVAGQCADEQGLFWEFHDAVFAEQEKRGLGTIEYDEEDIKSWARQVGMDGAAFDACLASGKYDDEVDEDIAAGSRSGVTGTPSFFINGRLIVGAQPFKVFQEIIEAELGN